MKEGKGAQKQQQRPPNWNRGSRGKRSKLVIWSEVWIKISQLKQQQEQMACGWKELLILGDLMGSAKAGRSVQGSWCKSWCGVWNLPGNNRRESKVSSKQVWQGLVDICKRLLWHHPPYSGCWPPAPFPCAAGQGRICPLCLLKHAQRQGFNFLPPV